MVVKITAQVSTPISLNSPLHLDGVLTATHPSMHNLERRPTRYDMDPDAVKIAPLPIYSARSSGDRYDWVWIATAAEFPDDAKIESDVIVKRWTPEDIEQFRLVLSTATGALRNRFVRFPVIVTQEVYFYCACKDVKELTRLLRRVKSIGGLRKSGYGKVRQWSVEPIEMGWRECLVKDGIARRRLPASFGEGATSKMTIKPPYWHNATRVLAADVGERFKLADDLVIV